MPVRYSDLPASVRAKVDAKVTTGSSKRHQEPCEHLPWRCAGCNEVFTKYAPAQRHSSGGCNGRHRLSLILEGEES